MTLVEPLHKSNMLYQWLKGKKQYRQGHNDDVSKFEVNQDNQRMQLTNQSTFILKFIPYAHNLTLSATLKLWVLFCALMLC